MSPRQLARIAGVLYLVGPVACGGFSQMVARSSVWVPGDAAATADKIRASEALFRAGFVTDAVNGALFIGLALVLYALFSPVNQKVAASFVVLTAIAATIASLDLVNHAAALVLATEPAYAAALGAGTADTLAVLFLDLHNYGYLVALIFFGLWLLPLGYVVYRSGYVPRFLGIGLMVACFLYLASFVAAVSAPGFKSDLSVYLGLPGALAELVFLVWLLIKGVNVEQPYAPN